MGAYWSCNFWSSIGIAVLGHIAQFKVHWRSNFYIAKFNY